MHFICILSLVVWCSGCLANGGSIALDNLIRHKEKEIHQTRKARVEEFNKEFNQFFNDLIKRQEKDLKRMTDFRSKLFPGKKRKISDNREFLNDNFTRELRKVENELFELARKLRAGLEEREAQEDNSIKIEILENPKSFEIRAEVPGVKRENIKIALIKNALTIGAERKEEIITKGNGVWTSEFSYGEFKRVIELPEKVKAKSMKIDYKDGILQVHLDKV